MLSKHHSIQRDQLELFTLDQLVPANHLVLKMETSIDCTFIYDLVKDMYSEVGRPSIDPVSLVKLIPNPISLQTESLHIEGSFYTCHSSSFNGTALH